MRLATNVVNLTNKIEDRLKDEVDTSRGYQGEVLLVPVGIVRNEDGYISAILSPSSKDIY